MENQNSETLFSVKSQEEITRKGNPAKPQGTEGVQMLRRMNESHGAVTQVGPDFSEGRWNGSDTGYRVRRRRGLKKAFRPGAGWTFHGDRLFSGIRKPCEGDECRRNSKGNHTNFRGIRGKTAVCG